MEKIDARKLYRDALKALRGQAMRLRKELGVSWCEINRAIGLNTTTIFGWAQRYAAQSEAVLISRKQGRAYLWGRTLTLPQDLRKSSPTYGVAISLPLKAESGHALYIAASIAHGFVAIK